MTARGRRSGLVLLLVALGILPPETCGERVSVESHTMADTEGRGFSALVADGFTGLVVVAHAFTCSLGHHEIGVLNALRNEGVPMELVLLAEPIDSESVDSIALDLGLGVPYRTMSLQSFEQLVGHQRFGYPQFVFFRRGNPVSVISGTSAGAVSALELLFK